MFQSTLPRGERLGIYFAIKYLYEVSIHAPARGATKGRGRLDVWIESVSIHAPARGATLVLRLLAIRHSGFNPRSREGSDTLNTRRSSIYSWFQSTLPRGERHYPARRTISSSRVSIHAPARGATLFLKEQFVIGRVSIHAPARGATYDGISEYVN